MAQVCVLSEGRTRALPQDPEVAEKRFRGGRRALGRAQADLVVGLLWRQHGNKRYERNLTGMHKLVLKIREKVVEARTTLKTGRLFASYARISLPNCFSLAAVQLVTPVRAGRFRGAGFRRCLASGCLANGER